MTTVPNISRGHHLVFVRNIYYCIYQVDGRQRRKSLQTPHFDIAIQRRDAFYASLGTVVTAPRTPAEKVLADKNKYISKRPAYVVNVGKHIGFFKTRKDAEIARDAYIGTLGECG